MDTFTEELYLQIDTLPNIHPMNWDISSELLSIIDSQIGQLEDLRKALEYAATNIYKDSDKSLLSKRIDLTNKCINRFSEYHDEQEKFISQLMSFKDWRKKYGDAVIVELGLDENDNISDKLIAYYENNHCDIKKLFDEVLNTTSAILENMKSKWKDLGNLSFDDQKNPSIISLFRDARLSTVSFPLKENDLDLIKNNINTHMEIFSKYFGTEDKEITNEKVILSDREDADELGNTLTYFGYKYKIQEVRSKYHLVITENSHLD